MHSGGRRPTGIGGLGVRSPSDMDKSRTWKLEARLGNFYARIGNPGLGNYGPELKTSLRKLLESETLRAGIGNQSSETAGIGNWPSGGIGNQVPETTACRRLAC